MDIFLTKGMCGVFDGDYVSVHFFSFPRKYLGLTPWKGFARSVYVK